MNSSLERLETRCISFTPSQSSEQLVGLRAISFKTTKSGSMRHLESGLYSKINWHNNKAIAGRIRNQIILFHAKKQLSFSFDWVFGTRWTSRKNSHRIFSIDSPDLMHFSLSLENRKVRSSTFFESAMKDRLSQWGYLSDQSILDSYHKRAILG